MSKTYNILLYTLLFVSGPYLLAQESKDTSLLEIEQPKRLEIDLGPHDDYFTVYTMKDQGIVMFRELEDDKNYKEDTWEIIHVDTSLEIKSTRNYTIDARSELNGYEIRGNYLYLLYRMGPYQKDDFRILKIEMNSGDVNEYDIKQIVPITLSEFTIVGNAALLGGYVNYRPALIHFDLKEQKIKVLPGIYRNNSELLELNVDESKNTFNVILTERTRDRRSTLGIKSFNQAGELLANFQLEPKANSNLLYGRSTKFDDEHQMVIGTYAVKKSSYARGLYIAKFDAEGQQEITYFNFGDLKNFFSYMKARREARIKQKIERRKIEGKKLRFNYRFLVHNLIEEQDGKYLMIGEAFYPKYNTNTYNSYFGGYYSRGAGRYQRNLAFEGFKYTHAIVIAFDKSGNLLYDNSFEINDVLSYDLDQFVNVSVEDDRMVLLYIYENVIRSKLIQGDEVLEGKSFNEIALTFEEDVAKTPDSEFGGLELWYDNKFFAYGVQKIKNLSSQNVKMNREVFFLNKIQYK